MMEKTNYKYRQMAKIVIEATTPLAIGSGDKNILTDAVVLTDFNGMPVIPGSTIAGLLRHALNDEKMAEKYFGFQHKSKGKGSMLMVTDAVMIGVDGIAVDGMVNLPEKSEFYDRFRNLPIRQHVRIGQLGTAEDSGKFDGQVVYKGTRFVFEMELCSETKDDTVFDTILRQLPKTEFRVGSGTRNGYGHVCVVSIKRASVDFDNQHDINCYLSKTSSLSDEWGEYKEVSIPKNIADDDWEKFSVSLQAEDFFLFGSGMSDDVADMTPVGEDYICWTTGGQPQFKQGTVIPASSVKGALLHRTVFWWNKINNRFADKGTGLTAEKSPAAIAIFGSISKDGDTMTRGKFILDDIIIPQTQSKIINHVAIDRFTGGALEGALFTERVSDGKDLAIDFEIHVHKDAFAGDPTIHEAFTHALDDLKSGMLPLGGGTNRGNGIFVANQ